MDSLKNKIRENKVTIGSWITIGHSSIAEVMSQSESKTYIYMLKV